MTSQEAESILSDENLQIAAQVLSAIDFLQSQEFNLMEPHLRKMGKFSESDVVNAANKAVNGHGYMAVPGNGQGIKMNLSVFLNSLQVLGREREMQIALSACQKFEKLDPQ